MNSDITSRIPNVKQQKFNYNLAHNQLKRLLYLDQDEEINFVDKFTVIIEKLKSDKLVNQIYAIELNIQLLLNNIK